MHLITCLLIPLLAAITVLGQLYVFWDDVGVQKLRVSFQADTGLPAQEYPVKGNSATLVLSKQQEKALVSIELVGEEEGDSQVIAVTKDDFQESPCGKTFVRLGHRGYHDGEDKRELNKKLSRSERTNKLHYKPY